MNCQLRPVIVADLFGRNFEVKIKAIALHFNEKLENFYEGLFCHKNWRTFHVALNFDEKLEKFNEVSFCHKNWCTFDGVEF